MPLPLIDAAQLSLVYVEERGIDLFNAVCRNNLEGVMAKRNAGAYATVSGWLKISEPESKDRDRRIERLRNQMQQTSEWYNRKMNAAES